MKCKEAWSLHRHRAQCKNSRVAKVAPGPGLEPGYRDPKSRVLPIALPRSSEKYFSRCVADTLIALVMGCCRERRTHNPQPTHLFFSCNGLRTGVEKRSSPDYRREDDSTGHRSELSRKHTALAVRFDAAQLAHASTQRDAEETKVSKSGSRRAPRFCFWELL